MNKDLLGANLIEEMGVFCNNVYDYARLNMLFKKVKQKTEN